MAKDISMEEFFGKIDDVTFKSYLACYEAIESNEIDIMSEIFERLKTEHIHVGKVVQGEDILLAVKFKPSSEKKNVFSESANAGGKVDDKDKKFLNSAKVLLSVLPTLSEDDRLSLNRLFNGIFDLGRGIGEKKTRENGEEYYPISYSKNNSAKPKQM